MPITNEHLRQDKDLSKFQTGTKSTKAKLTRDGIAIANPAITNRPKVSATTLKDPFQKEATQREAFKRDGSNIYKIMSAAQKGISPSTFARMQHEAGNTQSGYGGRKSPSATYSKS